jgi:thiosulfate reductase cytochrome b subunit
MHWLNAVAIILMIASGWRIYNNVPIFPWLIFPETFTLGGNPALTYRLHGDAGFGNALLWHFAVMWLLVLNGLFYLGYGAVTGRFRRMLLPIRLADVIETIREALTFKLGHDDITTYNAVQKLMYIGVITAVTVTVLAGAAIWKPVQLYWLTASFGGVQGARLVHFLGMTAIVLFLCLHVALALLVPRTILAMITGGPAVAPRRHSGSDAEQMPDFSPPHAAKKGVTS